MSARTRHSVLNRVKPEIIFVNRAALLVTGQRDDEQVGIDLNI